MHDTLIPEPIKLTYEDYCALPDDGKRWEILDGDLYMSPAPVTRHQRIVGTLFTLLTLHVAKHKLGEVFISPIDVILDQSNIVQPDVVFVSNERSKIVNEKNIGGSPDLVVEVLSPSRLDYDRRDKRNIYARFAVPFYWIVDPNACTIIELSHRDGAYATVAEFHLTGEFKSALFPDFTFDLKAFWR